MNLSKKLAAALPCLVAASLAVTIPTHAQSTFQVKVLTAGSSAQFGVFAEAAYKLAEADGNAKHYTVKSGQCPSPGCAFLDDARNSNIPLEPANLWVVWSATTGNIWAYASVDSVVGVRSFMAVPRATLGLASAASLPLSATTNLAVWDDSSNDTALPAGAYAAISGAKLTAANTDVRPEDALYATTRDLTAGPPNPTPTSFGYLNSAISSGTCKIGFSYQSAITTTNGPIATAVSFSLSGNDPCSHKATTPFITIPVGAAPIVFIANKSNASGLGSSAVTGVNVKRFGINHAVLMFTGRNCDASQVGGSSSTPIFPILREPTSGTYNTFDFTNINLSGFPHTQEQGVTGTSGSFNPLNSACSAGGGSRLRGIGTGDVVKGVNNTQDSIGYVFFSYEALPPSSFPNVKYLALDGVDPLHTSYFDGSLPTCGTSTKINCFHDRGTTFPNLRNGTYRSWSIYRLVTDAAGTANATDLVNKAQAIVDTTLADFVPFAPVCGSSASQDEPGLKVYRQHFNRGGITPSPNDGPLPASITCTTGGIRTLAFGALGGQDPTNTNNEAGGDVGGAIVYTPTGSPTVPGPTGTLQ